VILDTTLVIVSRRRARVPLVTAGRDHLTHRLLLRLRSPRRVALALGLVQALLCIAGIAGAEAGWIALTAVASVVVVLGVLAVGVLDSPAWRPRRAPVAPRHRGPIEAPYEGAPSTVESR
jgi:hypothetical protein